MSRDFSFRKIFVGIAAGLLSTIGGLILAYVVGVVAIAFRTRELLTTLLVAFTYLPLMLLFILLVPNIVITSTVGLTLGIGVNFTKHATALSPERLAAL